VDDGRRVEIGADSIEDEASSRLVSDGTPATCFLNENARLSAQLESVAQPRGGRKPGGRLVDQSRERLAVASGDKRSSAPSASAWGASKVTAERAASRRV